MFPHGPGLNRHAQRRKQNNNRGRRNRPGNRSKRSAGRDQLIEKTRFSQSSVPIHRYSRMTSQVVTLNPTSGFNTVGFDLSIVFSLNATQFFIGGVLASTASNPGASDFTSLYDQYRLEGVEVAFMYGANLIAPGLATAAQLPIMNIVFDATDVSTISLSSILQYQDLHVVQLGNQRTQNGYTVVCKPRPLSTLSSTAQAGVMNAPWISKDTPTVGHYGIKMFYDSAGSTLNAVMGTLTMYVKYKWAFRLSQ